MPAANTASPGWVSNVRPLGCTWTEKTEEVGVFSVILWVSLALIYSSEAAILPSNQPPLGALPSRFRRERVLIVGCGDVGGRVAALLRPKVRLLALTPSVQRLEELRAKGIVPLLGNLDERASVRRLSGLATRVVHLAPPASQGATDARTRTLVQTLLQRAAPRALVYGSTSGVYGDCSGVWVDETRAVRPQTARAQRRVDAELAIRHFGRASGTRASVLRIPGIYGANREGGTPRERLLKGLPALRTEDDVYTNHIHADDLARAFCRALWRAAPQRVYNVCDDSDMKMGDYFDLAADLFGLSRAPRISLGEAMQQLSPLQMSFMRESRRLHNVRMKHELGLRLHFVTVHTGLL